MISLLIIIHSLFFLTINGSRDIKYFCVPNDFSIDGLIRDLRVSDQNSTTVDSIVDLCNKKYGERSSSTPIKVNLLAINRGIWIVQFTFESFPAYFKDDNLDNIWYLYIITREPFSCDRCKVMIGLETRYAKEEGDDNSFEYQLKYGLVKVLFPTFIDYTKQDTIYREDKSKYNSLNITNKMVNKIGNTIYLDDNFFGKKNQYFLMGITTPFLKNENDIKKKMMNISYNPWIHYVLCYNDISGHYLPDKNCYPHISKDINECICWQPNAIKLIFMSLSMLTLAGIPFISFLNFKRNEPVIKEYILKSNSKDENNIDNVNIKSEGNSSENKNTKMNQDKLTHTKISVRVGYIPKKRLPGKLLFELKGLHNANILNATIDKKVKWSSIHFISNNVHDLILNYPKEIKTPNKIEVTLTNSKDLLYLYGITCNIGNIQATFPYSHYLKSDRTVILSEKSCWDRALRQINMITKLPITYPLIPKLINSERMLFSLFIFQTLAINTITQIEDYENGLLLAFIEGIASIMFMYTWLMASYVVLIKRHHSDKYFLFDHLTNYKFFNFIGLTIIMILFIQSISTMISVNRSVWRSNQFNSEIAKDYTRISADYDIKWIISITTSLLIYLIFAIILEKLFFWWYIPKIPGPLTFELGQIDEELDETLQSL